MTAETGLPEQFKNEPAARSGCERAAEHVVSRCGGYWQWIDDRTLRVFTAQGVPAMTFRVERTQ